MVGIFYLFQLFKHPFIVGDISSIWQMRKWTLVDLKALIKMHEISKMVTVDTLIFYLDDSADPLA